MAPATTTPTVTLADVAAHLGVSRTTVSNAYNRPNQLSPTLREKVLAAALELGYNGPDPMARGLRRGQTGSLGLVFDAPLSYAFTDPAAVLFLKGMATGSVNAYDSGASKTRPSEPVCPRRRPRAIGSGPL